MLGSDRLQQKRRKILRTSFHVRVPVQKNGKHQLKKIRIERHLGHRYGLTPGSSLMQRKVRSTSLVATTRFKYIIRISNVQRKPVESCKEHRLRYCNSVNALLYFPEKIHDSIADTIGLNTNAFTICSVYTGSRSPPQADINSS